MTLTNPTDDELNRAFAEKVAGWLPNPVAGGMYPPGLLPEMNINHDFTVPSFTRSMDAVLPWLEKLGWRGTSNRAGSTCAATVEVNHPECDGRTFTAQQDYTQTQTPLPRACVIALLRAHGVVVEFTK